MSHDTGITPMSPSRKATVRKGERQPRWGRVALAPFRRGGPLAGLAVGVLLVGVSPAWATHGQWYYEGTDDQGERVSLQVVAADGPFSVQEFVAAGSSKGKTELGEDCTPIFPPPDANDSPLIVDHAFSDTTPPVMISGSFSAPQSASGTFRFTSLVGSCDTGTVSWTASCANATPPCSTSPTFTGSGSGAKLSTQGRVTLPMTIGCPPPGVDCRVSAAATARVHASAAGGRKQVKLGRSDYVVEVGSSAKARFKLTTKGRRLLRRLGRIKAKVEIAVTRAGSVTTRTATVRLKAPRQTP